MGRETVLFKNEEKMARNEAAELLRTIAKRLEDGKVSLSKGKQNVTLKIPQRVEVEVKAEKETGKKRTKKKIEVEIEWTVGDQAEKDSTMQIS